MTYKITGRVIQLVQDLYDAGYEGEATLTNSYCTGTADYLEQGYDVSWNRACLWYEVSGC